MTFLLRTSFFDSVRSRYADSVFSELFDFFRDNLFSLELGNYKHLSVEAKSGKTIGLLIFAFALGIILASLWAFFTRQKLGGFVRALMNAGATDEKSAKTLEEMGYFCDSSVRKSLLSHSELYVAVRCAEEEAFKAARFAKTVAEGSRGESESENSMTEPSKKEEGSEFVLDLKTAHFYVPEDLKYRAENRFGVKGFTLKKFLLLTVIVLFVSTLLCRWLPKILTFADGILEIFANI